MPRNDETDVALALLKVAERSETYRIGFASVISKASDSSSSHWSQFVQIDTCRGFLSASKVVKPEPRVKNKNPTCPPDLLRWRRKFHPSLVSALAASLQTNFLATPSDNHVTYPLSRKTIPTVFELSKHIYFRDQHRKEELVDIA